MGSVLIPLSKGKFATIDEEDLEIVEGMAWHAVQAGSDFYAAHTRRISPKKCERIYMHRLIVKPPEGSLVDHANRNTLDNRRCNLRLATKSQNAANSKNRRRIYSRFRGVTWSKKERLWIASATIDGKRNRLGAFVSELEAAIAFNEASFAAHGAFAQLNVIEGVA